MYVDKNKIKDLILELGLVSQDDFDLAQQESKEKDISLFQIFLRKGLLNEQELQHLYMKVVNVAFVDLSKDKIKSDVLTIIPEPIVRQYNVIAFGRNDKELKVAMLDLDSLNKVPFLKKIGLRIKPYLTDRTSLNKAILQYQDLLKNEYGSRIQKGFLSYQTISEDILEDLTREQILELSRSKQISNIFELLLRHALIQNVSNIHIEPQEDNVLVRYRIDGNLYPAMVLPKKSAIILALKFKTLAGLRLNDNKVSQDGRFQMGFDGKDVDFRVHTMPSIWGEKIVLNIFQSGDSGFSLESIGFHGKALDDIYSILNKRNKIILIAGDRYSGRTTTFYTFLDLLKNPSLDISTIEESIGFQMNGINQTVTVPNMSFGVLDGIKQLSKRDCDVIAVDELGSLKSADLGVSLNELSKMTNEDRFALAVVETDLLTAVGVFMRSAGSNKSNYSVLDNLGAVVLQKLVSEISVDREEHYLSVTEIKKLSKIADLDKVMDVLCKEKIMQDKKPWSEVKFFKSVGEESGRKIMVGEVLNVNDMIRELMKKGVPIEKIEKAAKEGGMLTLGEDLIFKAVQGLISIEEILFK
jgi:type IV pilus assembly protein PilB